MMSFFDMFLSMLDIVNHPSEWYDKHDHLKEKEIPSCVKRFFLRIGT